MEFFRIRRDIPFMRHALIFNVISIVTFLIAVGALAIRGLHLGVDFTGGTVMEVRYPQAAEPRPHPRSDVASRLHRRERSEFRHLERRADPPAGEAGRDERQALRDR